MNGAKPRKKAVGLPLPQAEEYHYVVGWSPEDQAFIGRVAEFESLAAHGHSLESALREIKSVVRIVLADLAAADEEIPPPFSNLKLMAA